jgi:hypothetical protein
MQRAGDDGDYVAADLVDLLPRPEVFHQGLTVGGVKG